jgi:hypothetical protein
VTHTQRKRRAEGPCDLKALERESDPFSLVSDPRIRRQQAVMEPDTADVAAAQTISLGSRKMAILPCIKLSLLEHEQ